MQQMSNLAETTLVIVVIAGATLVVVIIVGATLVVALGKHIVKR